MIRSALILSAGLLAALCFACVAVVPPPPPPAAVQARAPIPQQTSCPVLGNILMVPASFDPTGAQVTPVTNGPAPDTITSDIIAAAYNIGPGFFLTQLCNLDGIFVTASPEPWGYRNINDGKRYIAVPQSLWNSFGPVGLDTYMNRVFGPPLLWPLPPTDPSAPIYLPPTPNTGGMTVLAALAHEFGHIFWSDTLVWPRGTLPQSSRFCSRILDGSWNGGPQAETWRLFEEPDSNPADIQDDSNDPPGPGDPGPGRAKVLWLINALANGQIGPAHRILWRILAPSRPFPSLLGAFSANEQFVETFMLYTLLHAQTPLTSLPLQVSPGWVRNIPQELPRRQKLQRALACFDNLVPQP